MALIFRVILLLGISWIVKFTSPLVSIMGFDLSGRDLILIVGGIFLLFKSTSEIHHKVEGEELVQKKGSSKSLFSVISQIIMLDIIFSFDSILTAVGLTGEIIIMVTAVIISLGIMMAFSKNISKFILKHPTLEMLALSFLILIGFMLVIDGLHYHVPKGYLYFAVFFSLVVEMLNMRARKNKSPLQLKKKLKE